MLTIFLMVMHSLTEIKIFMNEKLENQKRRSRQWVNMHTNKERTIGKKQNMKIINTKKYTNAKIKKINRIKV